MTLKEFYSAHPKAALGLSGGVDSAFLLWSAKQNGADVKPYFVNTAFQPAFELEDAKRLCAELSADLTVVELDILSVPGVAENPAERCYHCKRALFGALQKAALVDGYPVILDGTNASDEPSDRPGMRALSEMQVLSPLRLCGLSKDEIRKQSKSAGLFTWDKPAYACLATRVPTAVEITQEILSKIGAAEDELFRLGFSDFRVRYFDGAAKIQIPDVQLARFFERKNAVFDAISPFFDDILLDLKGR